MSKTEHVTEENAPEITDKVRLGDSAKVIEKEFGLQIAKHEEFTLPDGTIEWKAGNVLHRPEEEGPAVIKPCGETQWWTYNVLNREKGPAIERPDGFQAHFKLGKLHNEKGPAIITRRGEEAFYKDGKPHREDDLPAITVKGREFFFKDGKPHRTNGPVIKTPTLEVWKQDGELHNDNGPAYQTPTRTEYRIFGRLHNENGPAIETTDDKRFFLYGTRIHTDTWTELLERGLMAVTLKLFKKDPTIFDIAWKVFRARGDEENAKKLKVFSELILRSTRDASRF